MPESLRCPHIGSCSCDNPRVRRGLVWIVLGVLSTMVVFSGRAQGSRDISLLRIQDRAYQYARQCIESIGDDDESSPWMTVVGHGYGPADGNNIGLFPPLLDALADMADRSSILALTGDITRDGSQESFSEVARSLNRWGTVIVAPGNHDVGTAESRGHFEAQFGNTYGALRRGPVLVVWLDTNLDDWRISGDQLAWLQRLLDSPAALEASSLVVLTHHAIWSEGDGTDAPINGGPQDNTGRNKNELADLLQPLNRPALVISGDFGAVPGRNTLACTSTGNLSFVGSGVGGGIFDSVLRVQLSDNPSVRVCPVGPSERESNDSSTEPCTGR